MTNSTHVVSALSEAVNNLLAGYAEVARLLPEYGAPDDAQQALLAPLREAADRAAHALSTYAA